MAKKRKRSSGNTKKDEYVDVNPDPNSEDFIYGEIDDYHKNKDNELLAAGKSYKKNIVHETEEVLGIASDSDDDDDRAAEYEQKLKRLGGVTGGVSDSDEDQEEEVNNFEDDMLDTDVDDDDLEEHDALRIQKDSLKYLTEDDYFGFSNLQAQNEASKDSKETEVKAKKVKSSSGSYESQKVADELRSHLKELKLLLSDGDLSIRQKSKAQLLSMYCMNLNFFLALKSDGEDAYNHPVIERICQFKKAIDNFDSLFIVSKISKKGDISEEEEMEGVEIDEDGLHRPINKTIIQNRGILPYRKKENKNPRVRYRNKYRKAKIRRKGQFSEPRKEIKKYQGELTGINPGIIRSVTFK